MTPKGDLALEILWSVTKTWRYRWDFSLEFLSYGSDWMHKVHFRFRINKMYFRNHAQTRIWWKCCNTEPLGSYTKANRMTGGQILRKKRQKRANLELNNEFVNRAEPLILDKTNELCTRLWLVYRLWNWEELRPDCTCVEPWNYLFS